MDVRTRLCFEISRRLIARRPPAVRTVDYGAYDRWRQESLARSWEGFSDTLVAGKDVLDFGCGDGQLSYFLEGKGPNTITGVDIDAEAIARAQHNNTTGRARFVVGSTDGLPFDDESFDTIVAFDCMEHVMDALAIMREWRRVLRPGGHAVLEWFPFKGPWGPHMESLIPIPWAHVIFGERAMFGAAAAIYDLPEFVPRHWDLDESGRKKPNKWKQWLSFREQGYVNELDIAGLRKLASAAGLSIARFEKRSFGGSGLRRGIGSALMGLPWIGEYFLMYTRIELVRPVAGTRH